MRKNEVHRQRGGLQARGAGTQLKAFMREQVDPLKARLTTSALPGKSVLLPQVHIWNTPVHNNHQKKMSIF